MRAFGFLAIFLSAVVAVGAQPAAADTWEETVTKARGQTVFWNAWAGDERINAYIAWAGAQVKNRYGVAVKHVKLSDTAEAVSRVVAEKAAGRTSGGSVDLIWINGENFAAMKRNKLLFGPWTSNAPNYRFVDTIGKKTTTIDFTIPVDGLEAPWGMAQFVFMYDSKSLPTPPTSIKGLLNWAKQNKGRFTYPQPPNFLGTTFLKQALIELVADPAVLQKEVDPKQFAAVTAPLWRFLDALHPAMWRSGKVFPQNGPAQHRLLDDGEVDIALSFQPAEASSLIARGALPDTVRTFVLAGGTVGNTSFVAIPFNAKARDGAMVLADFLMSPEAQARKQNPEFWGSGTVLAIDKLPVTEQNRFGNLKLGIATLPPERLGDTLLEPHTSWVTALEEDWAKRYAAGK
ncbi:MAG: ABC transporter substrate-binding protein [Alphaproteobacteria bacterium]|nr:ABC transporter substrate-binding protein [Alphaproteobacteria bacterium]MCZ6590387.1 ABC transporter substrate-binding protein [Alphaproteobacteria bacterium]MCZ6837753.1 ABC transporter substrate-binding protein [Alphaproteobacteria bacterium]